MKRPFHKICLLGLVGLCLLSPLTISADSTKISAGTSGSDEAETATTSGSAEEPAGDETYEVAPKPEPQLDSAFYPDELIFNELKLTEEGVIAYDTLGNRWRYDFDRDMFIPGLGGGETQQEIEEMSVEERCTEKKNVKPSAGSVFVKYEEYVDGDITAYDNVTIKGWVKGNVQSLNGRVLVTETGRVDGDVKAPEIVVKEGGMVLGDQTISRAIDIPIPYDGFIIVIALTIFFMLIGFLAVLLAPKQMEQFRSCLIKYWLKSYLLGLLLFIPIFVVLAITLVGVILVPLAYVMFISLGVSAIGLTLGGFINRKMFQQDKTTLFNLFIGVTVFMMMWIIVALLLSSSNEVAHGFGIFALVVSIIISSYPAFSGIGAAILTRGGFREYTGYVERVQQGKGASAPPPAPPPIPEEPPLASPPPLKPRFDEKPSEPENDRGPLSAGPDKPDDQ